MIRTYAIWERRRSVLVILCISSAVRALAGCLVSRTDSWHRDFSSSLLFLLSLLHTLKHGPLTVSTTCPTLKVLHVLTMTWDADIVSELPGCRLASASEIIIVAYILLALSETSQCPHAVFVRAGTQFGSSLAMAILTGIKAYRHCKFPSRERCRAPLINVLQFKPHDPVG